MRPARFAATFASQNQTLFSVFDSRALPDQIDLVFDTAAAAHVPAVVILMAVRTEADLFWNNRDQLEGRRLQGLSYGVDDPS